MSAIRVLFGTKKARYLSGSAILIVILMLYLGVDSTSVPVETHAVEQGEFVVSIATAGELIANQSRIISAPPEIRSDLQIVELVSEGTNVKAGEFLLRFDTGDLENKLIEQQTQLDEYKLQLDETLAEQKTAMVQREASLQIQRYTHEQAKIRFELMKFEPDIKKRQAEIDMKKADLQLLEAEEDINRLRQNHQRALGRINDRIERQEGYIAETEQQIESATIRAPIDGLVVYKENYISGQQQKIKVGTSVHRRMQLIELPDLSIMKVQTAVNEVDISKLRRGQEVIIDMDADENIYYGTVTDIARLARNEGGAGSVKVFDVEVTIQNNDENLKPGMSATCQIITDRLDNALFVPIQSVFEEDGKTFVYLKDGYKKQDITTGQRNDDFIVVEAGLEQGQEVTLRDPFMQLEAIGKDVKEKTAVASGGSARSSDTAIQDLRGRMMRGDFRH